MALGSSGFFGTVTLVDNGGNTSTLTYDLTAVTIGAAQTDMGDIVTRLAAVTDGVVKGYSVGERYAESALSLPAGGVQVENTAVISSLISGTVDKYATIRIPAPKATIFVGSSGSAANVVDAADSDLGAYLATFTSGGEATVSDGEVLDTISAAHTKGKRVHRASRKG